MIVLRIESSRPEAEGFQFLWAKYVTGFDARHHCKRCLVGASSRLVKPRMATGLPYLMIEARQPWDWLYVCGVAQDKVHAHNLHLVARLSQGRACSVIAFNGDVYHLKNAEAMAIPSLPLGFNDLEAEYTTCRNYQFGVAAYATKSSRHIECR